MATLEQKEYRIKIINYTMDNINVKSETWGFRKLDKGNDEYGFPVRYVFEHATEPKAVRVSISEGGHIMKCQAGMWQVTLPRTESPNKRCFETKTAALSYAYGWVEAQGK